MLLVRLPAVRQQLADLTGAVHGQACHHIAQIGVGIVPVHARRLDQTHDGGGAFARAQAAGKQPVVSGNGDGSYLILDPVVVHRQLPVTGEANQRSPAF